MVGLDPCFLSGVTHDRIEMNISPAKGKEIDYSLAVKVIDLHLSQTFACKSEFSGRFSGVLVSHG